MASRTLEFVSLPDRVRGVVLGLACGDAWLAPYEGGPLERLLWRAIGRSKGRLRYTDDTQMNLDILNEFHDAGDLDQDALARRFAASYRWSRGYGPDAGRILRGIASGKDWRQLNRKRFKDGSFGNGAAMRAPAIALLYFRDSDMLGRKVRAISEITHCHPLGIDAALLVAHVVAGVLGGNSIPDSVASGVVNLVTNEFRNLGARLLESLSKKPLSAKEIRSQFGNSVLATQSVPAALYLSHKHVTNPFEELLTACRELGGDTDTIAAIAGSIWGGVNGGDAIPGDRLSNVEDIGSIEQVCGTIRA